MPTGSDLEGGTAIIEFQTGKRADEHIVERALWVFTMGTLGLYGVNRELNFVAQVSQYLYLDYPSVTENHW